MEPIGEGENKGQGFPGIGSSPSKDSASHTKCGAGTELRAWSALREGVLQGE